MTTRIEWATEVWNPVHGCTPISEGCANCYAARFAKRLAGRGGYPARPNEFSVVCDPARLNNPFKWKKPRRVFVVSMGDLFHSDVPDEFIREVYVRMAILNWHTFIVLTKRPARMREFILEELPDILIQTGESLRNVWHGVSVENQFQAERRIPALLMTPVGGVRFVSCEPLLGPVDLGAWVDRLGWVICGGETGAGARKIEREWVRNLRDQAVEAGVPFFFKRWGKWDAEGVRVWRHQTLRRVDGVIWEQYPIGG